MVKRVAIFILIAAFSNSVLVGRSLHTGDEGCGMREMPDCCKVAMMQGSAPSIAAAQLCCALNCPQPGTTTPATNLKASPLAVIIHPVIIQNAIAAQRTSPSFYTPHGRLRGSAPVYLRNLALLI
jgi:hypothetical protein